MPGLNRFHRGTELRRWGRKHLFNNPNRHPARVPSVAMSIESRIHEPLRSSQHIPPPLWRCGRLRDVGVLVRRVALVRQMKSTSWSHVGSGNQRVRREQRREAGFRIFASTHSLWPPAMFSGHAAMRPPAGVAGIGASAAFRIPPMVGAVWISPPVRRRVSGRRSPANHRGGSRPNASPPSPLVGLQTSQRPLFTA